MKKESRIIAEAIWLLENGQWRDKKDYLTDLIKNGKTEINGFVFRQESFSWQVWKNTDIGKQPQFKGEPLVKIIPRWLSVKEMTKVLDMESWTYI